MQRNPSLQTSNKKKRKKARAVAEENKDGSKSITSFDRPQEIKYSELEEYPQNDFNPEIIERRENNEIDSFKADESSCDNSSLKYSDSSLNSYKNLKKDFLIDCNFINKNLRENETVLNLNSPSYFQDHEQQNQEYKSQCIGYQLAHLFNPEMESMQDIKEKESLGPTIVFKPQNHDVIIKTKKAKRNKRKY